jgi:GT2 family glycosyltransferase
MQLNGYLDRFGEGLIYGWVWGGPDEGPITIEVRIDGVAAGSMVADEERADLARAGIGSGRHGFSWRVPERFYDGREHRFEVFAAGHDWPLPSAVSATLPKPAFDLGLDAVGRVTGWVVDPTPAGEPVEVVLRVRGVVAARDTASERLPEGGGAGGAPRAARGFALSPPAVALDALLDPATDVYLPLFDCVLSPLRDMVLGAFRVEIVEADARSVLARSSTPVRLARQPVEFSLNGAFAGVGTMVRAQTGSAAELRLWLDEADRGAAASIGASAGGLSLGDPVIHTPGAYMHFNRDVRLEAWAGETLAQWQVGGRASPVPVEGGADGLGDRATRIETDGRAGRILSQTLATAPAPGGSVDVHLGARAALAGPVEVRLSGMRVDGSEWTAARAVTVWTDWSVRAMRLATPPDAARDGGVTLSLEGGEGAWIEVGLFACIPPGTPVAAPTEASRPIEAARWNAVRAPDFGGWRPPLSRPLAASRFDLATGWSVYASKPAPESVLSLRGVDLLATPAERERRQAFGARLTADALTGVVRLEAVLDLDVLARGEADALGFHVSSPTLTAGQIRRVMVLRRTVTPAPESRTDDRTVSVLLGGVDLGRDGGRFVEKTLPLPARGLVRAAAEAARARPDESLVLAFEFEGPGPIDAVLTAVFLGDSGERSERLAGHVALEDPSIRAQLASVKGVAHWGEARTLRAADRDGVAPRARRPWRWPSPAESVEVVVCVHNAAEETLACLASLKAETTVPHTVTVIDDGSTEATRTALEAAVADAPWMRLVVNAENQGYTRSANLGISQSTADWVVLLNSDTEVTTGWLEGLLACARSDPAIALVGPISNAASWQSAPEVLHEAGGWMVNALPESMTPNDMAELIASLSARAYPKTPLLNGFCTLMKRSVVAGLGYFDEVAFPVGYGEENDLCVRVAAAGHALAVADDVYVHHSKSASFGGARRAELARSGAAAVRAKHPEVDLKLLQRQLAECTPLIELRHRLHGALADRAAFGGEVGS